MNLLIRIIKSFYKNIILKRKFKAYAMSFYDKEYRNQINNIYKFTKHSRGTMLDAVPVDLLKHGHKIIYSEYEKVLTENDHIPIQPIKVVQLPDSTFLVVDGNHRLKAVVKRAKKNGQDKVVCEVII